MAPPSRQPERDRDEQLAPGPAVVADDHADHAERDEREQGRVVAEQARTGRRCCWPVGRSAASRPATGRSIGPAPRRPATRALSTWSSRRRRRRQRDERQPVGPGVEPATAGRRSSAPRRRPSPGSIRKSRRPVQPPGVRPAAQGDPTRSPPVELAAALRDVPSGGALGTELVGERLGRDRVQERLDRSGHAPRATASIRSSRASSRLTPQVLDRALELACVALGARARALAPCRSRPTRPSSCGDGRARSRRRLELDLVRGERRPRRARPSRPERTSNRPSRAAAITAGICAPEPLADPRQQRLAPAGPRARTRRRSARPTSR